MIFSSISFLYYFLPILLIVYFIFPKKYKNLILLIFSLFFYFYGEPIYILLMLLSIIIAYIFGLLIDKSNRRKKIFLVLGIIICLLSLLIFKYYNFFITNINNLFNFNFSLLNIALPIGISFYTFQIISYLIDVYKKDVVATKSFINLATYVSLFPQLIAGPIVRYKDINDALEQRKITINDFALGVRRFVIGLFKKVIIANSLASFIVVFHEALDKSVLFYIFYAISITLQVYFDFSGYSDMAIGLGSIFGFKFLENFNYPLIANSITNFWRRWHISLSSWFKDYVYIPLGGNRTTKLKNLRNILIVWLLTGLWHGASWNFVIWGLYFFVFLIIEKFFLNKYLEKIPKVFTYIYTLIIVIISFVIFDASSLTSLFVTLKSMFGLNNLPFISISTKYYFNSYFLIFIMAFIGATPLPKILINKLKKNKYLNIIINTLEPVILIILLILVTAYLIDGSFNPFIYFRF